jgi:hypothetical protein
MIEFIHNPDADSRVVDGKLDIKKLKLATVMHIDHVSQGLNYIADLLVDAGNRHDNTKLSNMEEFHKAVESGCTRKSKWYRMHIRKERHHLSKPPEDVNLVDVLEHIVDCVMAGTARHEDIYDVPLSNEILQKAYKNTFELVKSQIVVKEEPSKILFGRGNGKSMSTDEVGGFHDDGIGWNPQGVFCGECVRTSCKGCVNEEVTDKGDVTKNA